MRRSLGVLVAILLAWPSLTSAQPRPPLVVALGDSITYGLGMASHSSSWPAQAMRDDRGEFAVVNDGIPGDCLSKACGEAVVPYPPMETRLVTQVIPLHPVAVVLLGGTNDLLWTSLTAAQIERGFTAIKMQTQRAGIPLIVSTIPPFGPERPWMFAKNAERGQINAWIVHTFRHVINFASHTTVKVRGVPQYIRSMQIGDGVHPSALAYQWFGRQAAKMLRQVWSPSR